MPRKESLISRPLAALTRRAVSRPKLVLALAVTLVVLAVTMTTRWLEFHTSRLDLLNPDSSFNQRWLAYLDEFGDRDDMVVVVEGVDPGHVKAAVEDLARELRREDELFASLLYKPDLSRLKAKALHYLPVEQLQALEQALVQAEPVLRGDWAQLNVLRQLQWAEAVATGVRRVDWQAPRQDGGGESGAVARPEQLATASVPLPAEMAMAEAARWHTSLSTALSDPQLFQSPWVRWIGGLEQLADKFQSRYVQSEDGRLGFLLLRVRAAEDGQSRDAEALARLREIIARVQLRHADVTLGLTGMPVLEHDEMQASREDSTRATSVGLLCVAVIFMTGFGSWRGPLLSVLTLLIALAWTLGYVTLAVGHLNILSVSFGIILIGLGIDFGIHYVARYHQLRETHDATEALQQTAGSVGPGVVSGGLTTALAFFAAALTHFTGVAELGVIAGGGVMLCLLAALFVLPVLLRLGDRQRPTSASLKPLPISDACQPACHAVPVLVGAGLVTALLAAGLPRLRYDHNLLNLQPLHLESVELERKLVTGSDRSVWFALSIADTPDELAQRKTRFAELDVVSNTEEIASLVPPPDGEKARVIRAIHARLGGLPERPPLIPVTPRPELIGQLQHAPGGGRLLAAQLAKLTDREYYQRVSRFQQAMAVDLLRLLRLIRTLAEPSAPEMDDLPRELVQRYVGRNGRHLLKVYGQGSIWDMEDLERFVEGVESVDRRVTGHPVQTYYASRQMQRSYLHAAVYSLLAVMAVLMLDFRSVRCTLLAILPLLLGVVQLFGLLGWLGIPLNPANMIVLPLILGIAVDSGVHIVHDFLAQEDRYRISNSTACALVLCSLTTMIGFGSMILARHQGLRSLGQVLTLGVFCCLLSSLLVLPPLLTRFRPGFSPKS